jgi:hypothetical protein
MDSGLYVQVFFSTEVIAAALFMIFLLPLVFYIASTRSRKKFVRGPSLARAVKRAKPARPAAKAPEEPETPPESAPPSRPRGPVNGPEDLK